MSKFEKILGVRSCLINELQLKGNSFSFMNGYELAMSDLVVLTRPFCETDTAYRHFATYCVVQDTDGKIFTYQRPSKNNEARLNGNYSIGVGGHMNVALANKFDRDPDGINLEKLYQSGTMAEISEELFNDEVSFKVSDALMTSIASSDTVLLCDDSNNVGKFHIAVIKRIVIDPEIKAAITRNEEIDSFKWRTFEELKDLCEKGGTPSESGEPYPEVENWSKLIIENWDRIPSNKCPSACMYGEYPFK